MAKSYTEYLEQHGQAPRQSNPGASGLSYSQIVQNGLQTQLDNGQAYRDSVLQQRAESHNRLQGYLHRNETVRKLQDYYSGLSSAADYVTTAPNSGRSVTDYQTHLSAVNQYTNSELMDMLREAYGSDSRAVQNTMGMIQRYRNDLGSAINDQIDYYTGTAVGNSQYDGKTLSEMRDEIQNLQNARETARQNGRSTDAADRLIRTAQEYTSGHLDSLTMGMSSDELREAAEMFGGDSGWSNFGSADANFSGNMSSALNRAANEADRRTEAAERVANRDARLTELLGNLPENPSSADIQTRIDAVENQMLQTPFVYTGENDEQNSYDYEILTAERDRLRRLYRQTQREEANTAELNNLLGPMDDVSAAAMRDRLARAGELAEGYVLGTSDLTTQQYELLRDEGSRLADEIWYADVNEALESLPTALMSRLKNGEDITEELQNLGYSEEQISNLLYYGKMQRDERLAREREQRLAERYTRNAGMMAAGTLGTRTAASLTSGLGFVDSTMQLVLHPERPINYNTALNRWANTDEIISEAIMQEVNWTDAYGNDAFDKLYQFSTSTLDSLASMLIARGVGVSLASLGASAGAAQFTAERVGDLIFFGSAAQSYMRDAINNGATDTQAIVGGLAAGAAEAFFEHFSLEHFYDSSMHRGSIKAVVQDWLTSAMINGSEETATELANILTDWMVMGGASDVMTAYQQLLDAGYTEEEARNMTIFSMAGRTIEAGISGALQGIVMGGVSSGISMYNTARLGARINEAGVQLLSEQTGRDLSNADNYDIGVAFSEVFDATRGDLVTDGTIHDYLRQSGVTGNIDEMTSVIRKTLLGGAISDRELAVMHRDQASARAYSAITEEKGVTNTSEFQNADQQNARAEKLVAQADANKRLVALAASTGSMGAVLAATQTALGGASTVESIQVAYDSDSGFKETIARQDISPAAQEQMKNLRFSETARIETENESRGENAEKINPISEEQFSAQYSAAYNTGKAFYDRAAEKRADVVKEYGEWAGQAFDLGAAETRDLIKNTALKSRATGSVSDITQEELQRLFPNGGAQVAREANKADKKMTAEERQNKSRRKAERKVAEYIAKAIGAKIVLYESNEDRTDNKRTENGWYDWSTGTIYLDVNAGDFGDRSMLRTLAHELTHVIQSRSPAEYSALRQFILDKYFDGKQELLDRRITEAMKADPNLKAEYAVDEVVADACEMMLRDSEAIKQLYQQDKNLFNRIKDFIDKFVNAIREAFEGVDAYSGAAEDMREYWADIQRLWDSAFVAASIKNVETMTSAGVSEDTAVALDENGYEMVKGAIVQDNVANVMESDEFQPPIDGHDVQNSPRTTPAWLEAFPKRFPNFSREDINVVASALTAFNEDAIARTAAGFLADSDPGGFYAQTQYGPLRTNVEYKYTFDLDTSCPRTFQFLAYRDRIVEAIGRPLTFWESENLINVMKQVGCMIPCTYCYVENKRILLSSSCVDYFKYRNAVMSAETDADAKSKMYGYNAKKRTLTEASQKVFAEWRADRSYHPSAAECYTDVCKIQNLANRVWDEALESGELTSDSTVNEIAQYLNNKYSITDKNAQKRVDAFAAEWKYDTDAKREHERGIEGESDGINQTALSVYHQALAYAKSASSAKSVENYTPYSGELVNISPEDRAFIMAMGGLRKHSSNDFRIDYVEDYFMLFADMAAGGWTGHTYTKNPDYVRIFGRTGDRINMSIALNGSSYDNITMNDQEGMNWAEARELRDHYRNAGIMCMVTNEAQLAWALDQDWIDMIIPFHASGLRKEVYKTLNGWLDFTSKQNESFWTKDEMAKQLKAAGYDLPKGAITRDNYMSTLHPDATVEIVGGGETTLTEVSDGGWKWVRPHFFPHETVIELKRPDGKIKVKVPGHENDPQKYLALCERFGVRPRFYNSKVQVNGTGKAIRATEHPNFFKLVKETSRTDQEIIDGKPNVQTAIKFNFNEYDPYLKMTPFEFAIQQLEAQRNIAVSQGNGKIYSDMAQDPAGVVEGFLRKENGKYVWLDDKNSQKYIDPAKDPYFEDRIGLLKSGYDEMTQMSARPSDDGGTEIQRSSRRPIASMDMIEAMDNLNGISNARVRQGIQEIRELYDQYKSYIRERDRLRDQIRKGGDKTALENRRKDLAKRRDRVRFAIEQLMEQKDVRQFLERERNEITGLFEESAISGRDYINNYYNTPMREALESTEAAWRRRYESLEARYDKAKLRAIAEKQEMRESFREYMERQQERRSATALREVARARLARLVNMVESNNDKTHVITELRGPVARFLSALNPIPTGNSQRAREAAQQWRDAVIEMQNLASQPDTSPVASLIIDQNKDAFADLVKSLNQLVDLISDDVRLTELGRDFEEAVIAANKKGTSAQTIARGTLAADEMAEETSVLDYMNSEQLANLNRVILAVQALVNAGNRVFANAKYENRQQMVEESFEELEKIDDQPTIFNEKTGKGENRDLETQRFLMWRNGVPYYVFKRFGQVGKDLYMALAKGWGDMALDTNRISEAVKNDGKITRKDAREWKTAVRTIELRERDTGRMRKTKATVAQLMTLYAQLGQEQSMLHIMQGGFNFSMNDAVRTDTRKYSMSREELVDAITTALQQDEDGKQISDAEVKKQLDAAAWLQHYMQVEGANMGNYVTRQLFGYEYFNPDEYYFPIHSSDEQHQTATDDKSSSLYSLLHMTMTRARNPKSNSAIVIGDIFNIFTEHMADMAKYKNLALPVMDMANWLNGKVTNENGSKSYIKGELLRAFGGIRSGEGDQIQIKSIAEEYITKFMQDINASYSGGGLVDQEVGKFLSRMKRAAVGASLRVALQQPFSYVRAMYSMAPKYLMRSLGIHSDLKQNIAEAKKYSGLAMSKSQGNFTSDVAPSMKEQIIATTGLMDQITEKSLALAEKMDEVTWGTLWRAAKYQVNDTAGHAEEGTKEYYEQVRQVFDEVILSTQVMDGTLTRSAFMRDKTLYSKLMTAFMAEPTLTYNMVLDGAEGMLLAKRTGGNKTAARNRMARAMAVWAGTQLANALITALVDAFRDDDDYETFWQKYLEHFTSNAWENMNPLEGIPIAKTVASVVISALRGSKSPLGTEFQGLTKSAEALRAMFDTLRGEKTEANYYGKMTTWGMIYNLLQGVSYLTGIPAANFSRLATSTVNGGITFWNDFFAPLTGKYVSHAKTYNSPTGGYDALFEAEANGNERRAGNLMMELAAHDIDGDTINKEMRNRTRDAFVGGEISESKARAILAEYGVDAEHRDSDINYWKFKRDFPDIEKPTTAMANHYYNEFQPRGVTPQQFATWWKYIQGCEKTDTMSLQEVRRQYITQLQVPESVKAALWHTCYDSEW